MTFDYNYYRRFRLGEYDDWTCDSNSGLWMADFEIREVNA